MIACAICDRKIKKQRHYGVQVCPACCAFFRRSLAERKEYMCKCNGKCNVKKEFRNSCRGCRLRRCFEAGMRREDAKNSTNSSSPSEVTHFENCQTPNSSSHIPLPISYQTKIVPYTSIEQQYPTLARLTDGFKKFQDAQKTVIIAQNSEIMLTNSKVKLIKKSLLDRLHHACVPLTYLMINDYFDLSQLLNFEQKHQLLKSFAMKIWFLINHYQTVKLFPNLDDTRQSIGSIYVIDYTNANHMHYFLCELKKPEEIFDLIKNIFTNARELTNKFIVQEFTVIEFAALAYIIFLIECEKFHEAEQQINDKKELVFKEIYAYYISKFGHEKGGIKFSNFFGLLHETMDFNKKLFEDLTIAQIFIHDFYNAWLELETSELKISDFES